VRIRRTSTPHVLDGAVRSIAETGQTVVLGGSFTSARDAGTTSTIQRPYLLAFDKTTGAIDPSFAPDLNGPVNAIAAGPAGSIYVGGTFTRVQGQEVP
jgi:hypothetical protein